jgi:hypothetical protein
MPDTESLKKVDAIEKYLSQGIPVEFRPISGRKSGEKSP